MFEVGKNYKFVILKTDEYFVPKKFNKIFLIN